VFSWIDQPNALDKIFAVAGDMTLPGLGISPADMQLLIEDVSIVINSAASVRFDDELKDALQTNVKGPRQLLAICQKMTKLEVCFFFSSLSTTNAFALIIHLKIFQKRLSSMYRPLSIIWIGMLSARWILVLFPAC
jgi:thioester reductase-like protein